MRTLRALLFAVLPLAVVGFVSSLALADVADPATDPTGAADQFWDAITQRKWGLAAVVGTMLVVAFMRFIAPRVGKSGRFGAFINSTRVSAALALVAGGLSAVATQLMKGGALSPKLIVYGFGFGVAAIGGYNAFWDLFFPNDKAKKSGGASVLLPFAFVAFAVSGCAPCTTVDNATCARKIVTGIDTVNGIVARSAAAWERDCREGADKLKAEGRIEDARTAYTKCAQVGNIVLLSARETQNGAQATADGIDAYEAAGRKDFEALMPPLRSALAALYKALSDAGVPIITKLPSVDSIFGGK